MKDKLSIIFMGTPEFATTILKGIFEDGVTIKAVVTAPDKPSGRGQNYICFYRLWDDGFGGDTDRSRTIGING